MPNHKKVFLALVNRAGAPSDQAPRSSRVHRHVRRRWAARKRRFHEFVYRKNHRLGSSMSARQIGGFGALMNRLHLLGLAATAAAGIVLSPSNAWAQG